TCDTIFLIKRERECRTLQMNSQRLARDILGHENIAVAFLRFEEISYADDIRMPRQPTKGAVGRRNQVLPRSTVFRRSVRVGLVGAQECCSGTGTGEGIERAILRVIVCSTQPFLNLPISKSQRTGAWSRHALNCLDDH